MAGETKLVGPDLSEEGIDAAGVGEEIPAVGHADGKPVVVIRSGGEFRAVGGRCTHYGGPLGEGLCVEGQIRCPWHHAAFDLATGAAVGGPALNPIPVYDVTERDGRLYVSGPVEVPSLESLPVSRPESVVIVGAGAAGAAAAEALRRLGYDNPVTLVGDEPPVDRPNLSKDYLAGTAPEEWIPLRSAEFYRGLEIELAAGRRVGSIDRGRRQVVIEGGERIGYGALLLAPGAEPRRLALPGGDLPHVHYLRSLADSRAIIHALDGVAQAAVIGAGFIGLEVAASLRERGIQVSVIAPEEVPLAHAVGETLGRVVRRLHEQHGVSFRLGHTVTAIDPTGITLDGGETVPAELVVVGVGVLARSELAAAAGLEVEDGITVDARLRTSDPAIWAAGDAARYPGPAGKPIRIEHWVLAQRQGQTAAANMLGHDLPFTQPPFFWSQHYQIPINLTGHTADWDEEVVNGDPDRHDVLIGYRKAGTIQAVASIHRDRENLLAEHALATNDQGALETLLTNPRS